MKNKVFSITALTRNGVKNMNIKQISPEGSICQERAAGTIFRVGNKMYRAIQDCTNCYGDYIKL